MSANLNNGTLRSLNRTPQNSNTSSVNDAGSTVVDTIRKRMQEMKDCMHIKLNVNAKNMHENKCDSFIYDNKSICLIFIFRLKVK
jgi:hypothetical protein